MALKSSNINFGCNLMWPIHLLFLQIPDHILADVDKSLLFIDI